MKKQYLFAGILIAALNFTACDEDYKDWADPQSNPQEEALAQVQASFEAGENAAIVMDDMAGVDTVEVLKFKTISSEGATFSPTSLLINGNSLPYVYENGSFKMLLSTLDSLTQQVYFSRASVARTLTVKAQGAAVVDGQGLSVESEEAEISLTPLNIAPEIDPKGYVMMGDWQSWTITSATPMTAKGDGIYQAKVTTTADENWFKFYAASPFDGATDSDWDAVNAVQMGCRENGDKATKNLLVWTGDIYKVEPPVIAGAGDWIVTLDMVNLTYTVVPDVAELYMTGSAYGWGNTWNQFVPVNGSDGAFWGMYYFNSGDEIKFAPQADWGGDFGFSDAISQSSIDRAGLENSGGNIKVGKAGWYIVYVSVNGDEKIVEFEEPAVYLIGNTAGGWDAAMESAKFEVPGTADGEFVSPAFVADDEIRAYASMPQVSASDWWRTEFMVFNGKIVFRGNGGDQDRVTGNTGQKLYLNFGAGTGSIK